MWGRQITAAGLGALLLGGCASDPLVSSSKISGAFIVERGGAAEVWLRDAAGVEHRAKCEQSSADGSGLFVFEAEFTGGIPGRLEFRVDGQSRYTAEPVFVWPGSRIEFGVADLTSRTLRGRVDRLRQDDVVRLRTTRASSSMVLGARLSREVFVDCKVHDLRADGSFAVPLVDGAYWVEALGDSGAVYSRRLVTISGRDMDVPALIALNPLSPASGSGNSPNSQAKAPAVERVVRVVDSEGGAVSGAIVMLLEVGDVLGMPRNRYCGVTGPEGLVTVNVLEETGQIAVFHPSWAAEVVGASETESVVLARRGESIRGRCDVSILLGGAVSVRGVDSESARDGQAGILATIGWDGVFQTPPLAPGEYELAAYMAPSWSSDVRSGQLGQANIQWGRGPVWRRRLIIEAGKKAEVEIDAAEVEVHSIAVEAGDNSVTLAAVRDGSGPGFSGWESRSNSLPGPACTVRPGQTVGLIGARLADIDMLVFPPAGGRAIPVHAREVEGENARVRVGDSSVVIRASGATAGADFLLRRFDDPVGLVQGWETIVARGVMAGGRQRVELLEAGRYVLYASMDGFALVAEVIEVGVNSQSVVSMRMERGMPIEVRCGSSLLVVKELRQGLWVPCGLLEAPVEQGEELFLGQGRYRAFTGKSLDGALNAWASGDTEADSELVIDGGRISSWVIDP